MPKGMATLKRKAVHGSATASPHFGSRLTSPAGPISAPAQGTNWAGAHHGPLRERVRRGVDLGEEVHHVVDPVRQVEPAAEPVRRAGAEEGRVAELPAEVPLALERARGSGRQQRGGAEGQGGQRGQHVEEGAAHGERAA